MKYNASVPIPGTEHDRLQELLECSDGSDGIVKTFTVPFENGRYAEIEVVDVAEYQSAHRNVRLFDVNRNQLAFSTPTESLPLATQYFLYHGDDEFIVNVWVTHAGDPDDDPEGAFDPSEHGLEFPVRIRSDFEHGQWWITDLDSGAQWSVVDCATETGEDYYGFEQVTEGDDE